VGREVSTVGDRRWRRLLSRGWPRFGVPRPESADPWAWLEPYPVPAAETAPRSLSIAFVAALQRLPPDQRAALVLSDVLDFPIAEVAGILDCDTAEAGDLLLRARSGMAAVLPAQAAPPPAAGPLPHDEPLPHGQPPAHGEPPAPGRAGADQAREEDLVVARFTGAFQRGDVAAIAALLTPDAWLRMRPLPVAYRGRRAARHFLSAVAFPGGTAAYRLVPTRANGQPAFGCYLRDQAAALDHACGLVVLTVDGGQITAIDRFADNSLLQRFGLPRTLPAEPR
jgi:ketosteroid isomerase-like protein